MLKSIALALAVITPASAPWVFSSAKAEVFPAVAVNEVSTPTQSKALKTWKIDQSHSELTFSVRHLVSRVRGQFTQWDGTIQADPDNWNTASVEVTIQTASVNTNNERRDAHLRTSDFFQADSFPTITFKSTKIERKNDSITINGNLTMRGVTKPVVLQGHFNGMTKSQNGKQRAGFEASTTINRMDYGVKWNKATEAGGLTVSEDVKIEINIAAVEQ